MTSSSTGNSQILLWLLWRLISEVKRVHHFLTAYIQLKTILFTCHEKALKPTSKFSSSLWNDKMLACIPYLIFVNTSAAAARGTYKYKQLLWQQRAIFYTEFLNQTAVFFRDVATRWSWMCCIIWCILKKKKNVTVCSEWASEWSSRTGTESCFRLLMTMKHIGQIRHLIMRDSNNTDTLTTQWQTYLIYALYPNDLTLSCSTSKWYKMSVNCQNVSNSTLQCII